MLAPGLIDQNRDVPLDHLQAVIDGDDTRAVLEEFKRPRTTDETIYLRNGSINRING